MMQTDRDLEERLRRDAAVIQREVQPDASFHHRIMARVTSTTASPVKARRSVRLPGQLALAAAFMVVALALGFAFSRLSTLRPAYRNDGAPPRFGMMIAADPARHQVVLFGGGTDMNAPTSDTWTWDGSSWTRRHPSSSPPARSYFSMAYDAARHSVVIFGGLTGAQGPSSGLNDTWVWDGTTWKEAHPAVAPPPTNGAPMAYDPSVGRAVLLDGGFTWTWDGAEWSKGAPAPPSKVLQGGMAFDPASDSLVLLAFSQATKQLQPTQTPPIVTWHFDGRAWSEQPGADIATPADIGATWWPTLLAEDPLSGSLMGVDGLGRTWSWDGTHWLVVNARKVTVRSGSAITYDPVRHLVMVFGGQGADGRIVSDLSVWDGKQWTVLPGGEQAKTSPTPRTAQQSLTALSLGTSSAGADWVIRRQMLPTGTTNGLYQSADGGRTWQKRLDFGGAYGGISWSPAGSGLLWSIDQAPRGCTGASSGCAPPTQSLTVYVTSDEGHHWTARAPTSWPAIRVYFRGVEGWAASTSFTNQGGSALYHTTDGGASWVALGPAPGGSLSLFGYGLEFVSSQRGWFATNRPGNPAVSVLLTTADGGHTWVEQPVQPPAGVAQSDMMLGYPVFLTDGTLLLPASVGRQTDQNGFAIDRLFIYSSADGGSSWTNPQQLQSPLQGPRPVGPPGAQFQDFFLDSLHWWITAVNGPSAGQTVPQAAVARTTDGGKTWQIFESPIIVELRFTDAAQGWASAVTGADYTFVLLRTTDGGAHWQRVQFP